MVNRTQVQQALDAGGGLLRLEPSWVPRSFMVPGRRLKLHPDDVYALGGHRGGINERWFSSTTNADNGPGTPPDEGLSYVRLGDGSRFLLKDAVDQAGDACPVHLVDRLEIFPITFGRTLRVAFPQARGVEPHERLLDIAHRRTNRLPVFREADVVRRTSVRDIGAAAAAVENR